MPKTSLLQQLKQDFQQISFTRGQTNSWSAKKQEIVYSLPFSKYSVLHELGHAMEGHADYGLDIQLLKLEADAWQRARTIARDYGLTIPQHYVNKCMNTYKDWLLARARCPDCDLAGIQSAKSLLYNCYNCRLSWSVPVEPRCFVRRIRKKPKV